jgi:hypothetical protein
MEETLCTCRELCDREPLGDEESSNGWVAMLKRTCVTKDPSTRRQKYSAGRSTCEVQRTKAGQQNGSEPIVFCTETELDVKDRRNVGEEKLTGE